jgi:hypothetical protein
MAFSFAARPRSGKPSDMKSKLPAFALGLVLGAAGVAALAFTRFQQAEAVHQEALAQAQADAATNRVADLDGQLAKAEARTKRLEADNLKLATRVQELMKQTDATARAKPARPANPFAAMFGGGEDGDTNQLGAAMQNMMKAAIEQQVEGKVGLMKSKLKLTPEQEKAAREILGRQFGQGQEIAAKMMKGELSAEDAAASAKDRGNPEAELKALLTPEQQAGYEEMQKEERTTNARLLANSELIQMQSSLGLDQAQQDKVFAVLYDQASAQLGGDPANANPIKSLDDLMQRKLDALKGVLTDDQFARYQKFQQQQQDMIKAFLPKDGQPISTQFHIITKP